MNELKQKAYIFATIFTLSNRLQTLGDEFDENFTTDGGLVFKVGTGNVIPGWDQGVPGMKVGGTRRLVIPSDLAYGENGSGSIPANADLVFVVKVLEIKK